MLHGTGKGRTMDLMLTDMPMHYAGGGFPWGLLIIGGIGYFLWSKGVFDGRGRFGNGGRFVGFGARRCITLRRRSCCSLATLRG